MIDLNSRQRAFLRSLANPLADTVQIGKGGYIPSMAADIDSQLTVRELVKIHVMKTAEEDIRSIAARAAEDCSAVVVQVVGRKIVLYRHSSRRAEEGKAIRLPVAPRP